MKVQFILFLLVPLSWATIDLSFNPKPTGILDHVMPLFVEGNFSRIELELMEMTGKFSALCAHQLFQGLREPPVTINFVEIVQQMDSCRLEKMPTLPSSKEMESAVTLSRLHGAVIDSLVVIGMNVDLDNIRDPFDLLEYLGDLTVKMSKLDQHYLSFVECLSHIAPDAGKLQKFDFFVDMLQCLQVNVKLSRMIRGDDEGKMTQVQFTGFGAVFDDLQKLMSGWASRSTGYFKYF